MELVLFSGVTYFLANKMKHEPFKRMGEGHIAYGQSWRTGVHPDVGANMLFHPQQNLIRTDYAGFDRLPIAQMRKTHIVRGLNTTANDVNRDTSHFLKRNGYKKGRTILAEKAHYKGMVGQYASLKDADFGRNKKMRYIMGVTQNPGALADKPEGVSF